MTMPSTTVPQWMEQAGGLLLTTLHLPLWLLLTVTTALAALLLLARLCHQRTLRTKAWLMNEAVRNEDFTFRLSTRGMPSGERALLDTLNNLGQEIGTLMDRREVESWQRLTRVLTHEIMNATAPISSITQAWLASPGISGSEYEEGLKAIQHTTAGLTAFVENFRKMTLLQEPVLREVDLGDTALSLRAMYPQVEWHVHLQGAPTVQADSQLLRQALVNICKNATEAGATRMGLHWRGGALLISNNGSPIPSDVRRQLFVPFFTTKHSGSGIGLPFSRQIIMAQGGNISLLPVPVSGYHTTFAISFKDGAR